MLARTSALDGVLGARVRVGRVPDDLPDATRLRTHEGVRFIATENEALYEDPFVRLLVRGTDEVVIEVRSGWPAEVVEPYVYGIAARVLLVHSDRFTLHASVAALDAGGVVAIGGESGAGKSTTSVALARAGGRLLVDDVTPLVVEGDRVVVVPFERPVHLFADVADGWQLGESVPVERRDEKVALRLATPSGPVPVDRLIVLQVGGESESIRSADVRGGLRLQWIIRLSNVTGLASLGSRRDSFFDWASQVADRLPLTVITRPDGRDTLAEVVALMQMTGAESPR